MDGGIIAALCLSGGLAPRAPSTEAPPPPPFLIRPLSRPHSLLHPDARLQRAVTMHGVHQLRVVGNVAYNTMGHTYCSALGPKPGTRTHIIPSSPPLLLPLLPLPPSR